MFLHIIILFVLLLFLYLLYYMNTDSFKRALYHADYEAIQELREVHFQQNKEFKEAHQAHISELQQKSHTG